ncbi:ethanolamine ammonia-lyase subunit EutC [Loktanella salsilacus]|uniref:ethanolamine ammonia-lyase subunit EutC n=1 Tax=Loktanella salsilacus TaxID=195913 RepID=UPI0037044934
MVDRVTDNPWRSLRRFTDARIGTGRAGVSLPTAELLAFQMAHAQARDAVHQPLDVARLVADLGAIDGVLPALTVQSQAVDRADYLRHPDKGRRLAAGAALPGDAPDLAIVIADGLSSRAVQDHAAAMVAALMAQMPGVRMSAPVIAVQGRVAIGDDIAAAMDAAAVLVLIGERPGLSSPDSLGLYFTQNPGPGLSDARRNCISNVRPAGLLPDHAAARFAYLYAQAQVLGTSGVALKDNSAPLLADAAATSFLSPPRTE